MLLSKISLKKPIALFNQLDEANEYRIHQTIWKLFPDTPRGMRPFLYRLETQRSELFYYILSEEGPIDPNGLWIIQTKDFNPVLKAGDRMAFSLRASPTVTRKGQDGKARRHDVVMDAKIRLKQSGLPKHNWPNQASIELDAASKWLSDRAAKGGFEVHPGKVDVSGYRQMRIEKRKEQEPIRFSVVDFQGILTVLSPSVFLKDSVFSGIGAAKGFGCGLLLLRRV